MPILSLTCTTPPHLLTQHLQVTLLPHEAPDPGQYPLTQLLLAVKDQSSWGKGNWGNACFSSPVFTAGVPAQLFRKQAQLQYPKFRNLTHSVFNACGFIKPQIHHESTEKIIKHHSGIENNCFHGSSTSTENTELQSAHISTVTLQSSSSFSHSSTATSWTRFSGCQTENVQRKIILFTANTWDFK